MRAANLTAALACLILAAPAHASLGGSSASVEADRIHMAARLTASTTAGAYSVHALTLPNRGVTREFMRGDGTVFAVAWRGPGRPDLRQLLGPSFATVQADNVRADGRRTHRPLSVERSELIVRGGGHSGAFFGFAYLPKLAPAGFSAGDLQ